ncbi:MICAL-like protein 2 [Larimichthys crocea]|uniref:Uncharacterized protein n=1 Tax=Larimichthys crocea TaxID=215358 RepID=A0ACD3R7J1_LARCR|nr:MICAL-like protein 2 [Larimichthys crocea]
MWNMSSDVSLINQRATGVRTIEVEKQQLMDELVAIIEQRNEIISNLDQDRQREREEDLILEDMMKNKEFQKEELKEIKKSKGKFRASKVFKMLNHKSERSKDSTDKKS